MGTTPLDLFAIARAHNAPLNPTPEALAEQRGYLSQAGVGAVRGVLGTAELPFRALSAVPGVRSVAEPVAEYIESAKPVSGGGVVEQGVESGVQSLGTLGLVAGTAGLTGGASLAASPALLAGGVGTLYGGAQFAETRNRLERYNATLTAQGQPPLTTGEITTAAGLSGLAEGGGEALADFFFARSLNIFGLPGATSATQTALRALLPARVADGLAGRAASTYLATVAREAPTEALQAAAQSAAERGVIGAERLKTLTAAGVPVTPAPGEAAAAVVGPVAVSSALFAGVNVATQRPARPQPAAGGNTQTTAETATGALDVTGEAVGRLDPLANDLLARLGQPERTPGQHQRLRQALLELQRSARPGELSAATLTRLVPPPAAIPGVRPAFTPSAPPPVNPLTGEGAESIPLPAAPVGAGPIINPLTGEVAQAEGPLPTRTIPARSDVTRAAEIPVEVLPESPTTVPVEGVPYEIPTPVPLAPERQGPAAPVPVTVQPETPAPAPTPTPEVPVPPTPAAPLETPVAPQPAQPVAPSAAPVATAPPEGIQSVAPEALTLDPERFQYKILHGERGTTGSLADVKAFDPELAGVVQVWQDPADGKTYVINGHNRVDLARRANAPALNVQYVQAQTPEQARSIGALTNIAEGRGTAVDAAKFFRDTGATPEKLAARGLSVRDRIAREGVALARLNPSLFGEVSRGAFPVERAVIIGERLPDHADQFALLRLIETQERRGRRITNDTLRELAEMVTAAPSRQEVEQTLFGAEERTQNLAVETADLLAHVRQRLAKEKRLFGLVGQTGAATELERAGNVIDVERSQEVSQQAATLLDIFDRLKHLSGPVRTSINAAAQRIAGGENATTVRRDLYQQLLTDLPAALGGGSGRSSQQREAVSGAVPAGGETPTPDDTPGLFGATPEPSVTPPGPPPVSAPAPSTEQLDPAEQRYQEAVAFVVANPKQATMAALQREFRLPRNEASVFMTRMQAEEIVGPAKAFGPRDVLRQPGQLQVTTQTGGLGAVTQRDVQRAFPGQAITQTPEGTFVIQMPRQGHTVELLNVAQITPTQTELEVGYGQTTLRPDQTVAGRATPQGHGLFRIEVTPDRTALTLFHEAEHVFEDMGLLTARDIATLNRTLLRQGQAATAENRADLLATRLNDRAQTMPGVAPFAAMVRKIQQFFDRMARLVGIRTTGQLVRAVESGTLFTRSSVVGDGSGQGRLSLTHSIEMLQRQIATQESIIATMDASIQRAEARTASPRPAAQRAAPQRAARARAQAEVARLRELLTRAQAVPDETFLPSREDLTPETAPDTLEGLRALTEQRRQRSPQVTRQARLTPDEYRREIAADPQRRQGEPPPGRLQVVENATQTQADLPLTDEERLTPEQVAQRAIPSQPQFRGFTPAAEYKQFAAYAALLNNLSPELLARLNDRPTLFNKMRYGQVARAPEEQYLLEQWAADPDTLLTLLRRQNEAVRPDQPNALGVTQAAALRRLADGEYDVVTQAWREGVFSDAEYDAWLDRWQNTHGVARGAVQAASTFGRGLQSQQETDDLASLYRRAKDKLAELAATIPEADRTQLLADLREAIKLNDPIAVRAIIDDIPNPTWRQLFFEFYYGSILSNPSTWGANLFSGLGYQVFMNAGVKPLAATIDRGFSLLTGRTQSLYAQEALPTMASFMRGIPQSFQHFWWLWSGDERAKAIPQYHQRDSVTARELARSQGAWARATDAQGQPIAVMRMLAPAVNVASRALSAMDVALRELSFNSLVAGRARREALRLFGEKNPAWEQQWVSTMSDKHPVFQEILDESKVQTFHDPIGQLGTMLIRGRNLPGLGPFLQLIQPFASTPDRLLARGWELVPGSKFLPWLGRNVRMQGWLPSISAEALTPEASLMLAKQLVGTVMTMALYGLWTEGLITGAPPEDPAERDAFYRRGDVAFGVTVGDTRYSWRRFEPMNMPLGVMVSVFEAMARLEARREQRGEVPVGVVQDKLALASVAVQAVVSHVLEASYFSGIAAFFQGTQRGREAGDIPSAVLRQVASVVTPYVGFQRALIRATDTLGVVPGTVAGQATVRQPTTLAETFASMNLPLAYTSAAPPIKQDVFGRPQTRETSALGELFPGTPPVQRGTLQDSAVEDTLARLRYFPGLPAKSDALGKAYSPAMYRDIVERRGEILLPRLEQMVTSRGFQLLTDADQRKRLKALVTEAGTRAKREVVREAR